MPLTIKNGFMREVKADLIVLQKNYSSGFLHRRKECNGKSIFKFCSENRTDEYVVQHDLDELCTSYAYSFKHFFSEKMKSFKLKLYQFNESPKNVLITDELWIYPKSMNLQSVRFSFPSIINLFRKNINIIMRYAEDNNFHSIAVPILGLSEVNSAFVDTASIVTVQSIRDYLEENGDRLNITLVIGETGLPYDISNFHFDVSKLNMEYIRYLEKSKEMSKEESQDSVRDTLHALEKSGLIVSKPSAKLLGEMEDISPLKEKFLQERRLYLLNNPNLTSEMYGRDWQIDKIEWFWNMHRFRIKFDNSPVIKTAIENYCNGVIGKLPKIILIKLGLAMKLSFQEFCQFIWATGDEFPYDNADYAVLEQVRQMKFDYELNLSDDYEMLYQYVDALHELYLQNNQFFAEQKIGYTSEIYGKNQQYDIITETMKKRGISANKIAEETGMSRNTIKKYVEQVTEKLDKITAIRIAVALKLPLEEFCIAVWGSGAVFPSDDAERVILQCVCNEIYDINIIDSKLAPLTDKRIYSENHKQKEPNS